MKKQTFGLLSFAVLCISVIIIFDNSQKKCIPKKPLISKSQDCADYLRIYPDGNYKTEVADKLYNYAKSGNLSDCELFLKALPKDSRAIEIQSLKENKEKELFFQNAADNVITLKHIKCSAPNLSNTIEPSSVYVPIIKGLDFVKIEKYISPVFIDGVKTFDVTCIVAEYEFKKLGIQLVLLPPLKSSVSKHTGIYPGYAKFSMGSPEDIHKYCVGESIPYHKVELSPFLIAKTETTQKQWKEITGITYTDINYPGVGDDYPIYYVNWNDCKLFCNELNKIYDENRIENSGNKKDNIEKDNTFKQNNFLFTLPTEAQWEYSCRAGTTTMFYFGNYITSTFENINGNFPYPFEKFLDRKGPYLKKTTPVGSYKPNAFGLYDMLGNVSEYCEDTYHVNLNPLIYPENDIDIKRNPLTIRNKIMRVVRGGAWSFYGEACRSSYRSGRDISISGIDFIGFRIAFLLN